jgi:hypothetical protein
MPRRKLADRIEQFLKAVPEWFAAEDLRARAAAAVEDEFRRGDWTWLSITRLAEADNRLAAARAAVREQAKAIAEELERRTLDTTAAQVRKVVLYAESL